ncbi:MAG: hypothetical protein ABIH21_03360 [Patescibacteria group bacterium]
MAIPETVEGSFKFWQAHIAVLEYQGASSELLQMLASLTARDNIGMEGQGQIRPGDLGRWDIYYYLDWFTLEQRLLVSALTQTEVDLAEREADMEAQGIDLCNPVEVSDFERLEAMSSQELSAEIARLTAMLEAQ